MVEDCLLGSGQLVNLDYPVDFHDQQCARAHDGIFGRLEGLEHRPDVLKQRRGDVGVLRLYETGVGDVWQSRGLPVSIRHRASPMG
jgi:hypothetical protein